MILKQIVAGSGDLSSDFTVADTKASLGPIAKYVLKLTGKDRPNFCFISTASGDSQVWISKFYDACSREKVDASHLQLFKSPNHPNIRKFLLAQDAIWVEGGSTQNLLAVWEVHGIHKIMREAWEQGIVLAGYSAGSECWAAGGTTRSYGPPLQPFNNKFGLLPFSSGVHNDIEDQRRPVFHKFVLDGKIPAGYTTEEGVSIHFVDDKVHKVIADREGKSACFVHKEGGKVVENRLEPELLV